VSVMALKYSEDCTCAIFLNETFYADTINSVFADKTCFAEKKTSKFHGNVLACLNQFRIRNTQLKILLVLGGQVYRFLCGRSGLKGLRPFHTSPTIDDIYRHCVLSSQVV